MAFIAFLGCDGSGKSAVLDRVTERTRAEGITVFRGHWRPRVVDSGESQNSRTAADDPHGQQPRGTVSSIMKLGWLWLNWWVGWWKLLSSQSRCGLVLFDRYHADLLVDPKRYRYGAPIVFARIASRLMPQPDRVFFLDAAPEILLSRKQEVGRDALERSRARYLQLAKIHERIKIIDASKPLEEVVDEVCGEIRRMMRSDSRSAS